MNEPQYGPAAPALEDVLVKHHGRPRSAFAFDRLLRHLAGELDAKHARRFPALDYSGALHTLAPGDPQRPSLAGLDASLFAEPAGDLFGLGNGFPDCFYRGIYFDFVLLPSFVDRVWHYFSFFFLEGAASRLASRSVLVMTG